MNTSIKFALGAVVLAVASSASAALNLSLVTREANAKMTVGAKAMQAANAASVTLSAAGTTTRLADAKALDPRGREVAVAVFNMPATKSNISITKVADALPVRVNSGDSSGAALVIESADTGGKMVLANFSIDFNAHKVYADIIDANTKVTKMRQPLYTFSDIVVAKAKMQGLSLLVHGEIGTLVFTPEAAAQLAEGLALGDTLAEVMKNLDWGTIVTDVDMLKHRATKISAKAYVLK
jgi:hypothetical protein